MFRSVVLLLFQLLPFFWKSQKLLQAAFQNKCLSLPAGSVQHKAVAILQPKQQLTIQTDAEEGVT